MKTKVFARLKPKAVALGFNKSELEGIAAHIASNLNSETATDEDIDASIEAALPLLTVAQSVANRTIEAARNKPQPTQATEPDPNLSGAKTPSADDEPAWFKTFRDTQEKRLAAIEGEKVSQVRKVQLSKLIEKLPENLRKPYNRMAIDNLSDEDFATTISEVTTEVESIAKDLSSKGATFGRPLGGGVVSKTAPSAEEMNALSEQFKL